MVHSRLISDGAACAFFGGLPRKGLGIPRDRRDCDPFGVKALLEIVRGCAECICPHREGKWDVQRVKESLPIVDDRAIPIKDAKVLGIDADGSVKKMACHDVLAMGLCAAWLNKNVSCAVWEGILEAVVQTANVFVLCFVWCRWMLWLRLACRVR